MSPRDNWRRRRKSRRSFAFKTSTTSRTVTMTPLSTDSRVRTSRTCRSFHWEGFTPLQSTALATAAASLGATPMQVALAWLLQRAANILLIPGTSSVEHLRENLEAARLQLPPETLAEIDSIAGPK